MAQEAEPLAPWSTSVVELFQDLSPMQSWEPFASMGIWSGWVFLGMEYAAFKTEEARHVLCFLQYGKNCKMQSFVSDFVEKSTEKLHCWSLKIKNKQTKETLHSLYLLLSRAFVTSEGLQSIATFCSSDQINILW